VLDGKVNVEGEIDGLYKFNNIKVVR
jgi:hypothetical protein